jgi:hypothetical protein
MTRTRKHDGVKVILALILVVGFIVWVCVR